MNKMIKIKKFRKMLQKGKIHFEFTKKDGTLREALGTLNSEFIPMEMQPKEDNLEKYENLRYFDLDKNAWRSISSDTREVNVL
jgi:hypothetical protein